MSKQDIMQNLEKALSDDVLMIQQLTGSDEATVTLLREQIADTLRRIERLSLVGMTVRDVFEDMGALVRAGRGSLLVFTRDDMGEEVPLLHSHEYLDTVTLSANPHVPPLARKLAHDGVIARHNLSTSA